MSKNTTNFTPTTKNTTDFSSAAKNTTNFGVGFFVSGVVYNEAGRTYNADEQTAGSRKKIYNGIFAYELEQTGIKNNSDWSSI